MRNREPLDVYVLSVVPEDVKVERPGIPLVLPDAPVRLFDLQQPVEQGAGVQIGVDADNGVQVCILAVNADGCSLEDRGTDDEPPQIGEGHESGIERRSSISKIRTDADVGLGH